MTGTISPRRCSGEPYRINARRRSGDDAHTRLRLRGIPDPRFAGSFASAVRRATDPVQDGADRAGQVICTLQVLSDAVLRLIRVPWDVFYGAGDPVCTGTHHPDALVYLPRKVREADDRPVGESERPRDPTPIRSGSRPGAYRERGRGEQAMLVKVYPL